jgi:X-X-X-Leu-X-X-Gly heptad repeat protein
MKARVRRGVAVLVVPAMILAASQVFAAPASDSHRIGVVVARLDAAGFPTGEVTLNQFTRSYSSSGSKDSAAVHHLKLVNGLVSAGDSHRALPVVVAVRYFLDGQEHTASEIAGKSGAFKVEWTVTNRTARTEEVTYTDSSSGAQRTATAVTVAPFTVDMSGVQLPDASFDQLKTNGTASRSAANNATNLSWTAVLAPPVFPGSAVFTLEGNTSSFKLPGIDLVATPGLSGAIPDAAKDASEKGGAQTATVRGYVDQFGDGFAQLGGGLVQLKGGVDQIFDGLNTELKPGLSAPNFDRALFNEDSTLANNQPGLLQGLQILGDGLGKLVDGVAQVRGGLSTGSASQPGVKEGLQQIVAGIGQGNEFDSSGNPLTLRASLNALRVGLASGNPNAPGIVEGLHQVSAAIGAGTEFDGAGKPLTLRASLNAIRAGLSSGDPNAPAILEGLDKIFTSIGNGTEFNGTTPLTVAASLAAIRGGLKSGDLNNPRIIEGLQKIYASIGNGTEFSGTTPLSLAASLVGIRAALSSGNPANPAILEGLQQIYAGIGNGTEFSGTTPLTVRASINAMRAGLSSVDPLHPGAIEGIQQVLAGLTALGAGLDTFAATFITQVNTALGGFGLPLIDPLSVPVVQGALNTGVAQAHAALGQITAGLSSGDQNNPAILEGLQKIYAGLGDGTEFAGTTALSVAASLVAMRAALSSGDPNAPKIIEGVQKIFAGIGDGTEFSGTTPLSIAAGLRAIRAGLQSGDPNNPAILEGLDQIYTSIGTGSEFSGTTPLTIRAGLEAIRQGLKSGDPNNPKIVEGLQQIYGAIGAGNEFSGTTPLTLAAGLVALQQGLATIAGGAQLASTSIGTGSASEFVNGTPKTVAAAVVALGNGASQLTDGIAQIVTGLGDMGADGKPAKAVTKRTTRFGNVVEDPATLLWGLQSARDSINDKFVSGVNQIIDALGDPNVQGATILSGMKQVSDGLGQAGAGATTGSGGASTLSHVMAQTVSKQDIATALQQAGVKRADRFAGFNDAGGGSQQSVFVLRLGGVG